MIQTNQTQAPKETNIQPQLMISESDITWPSRSPSLGNLFGALAKAQAEYKVAVKKSWVKFVEQSGRKNEYNFADLQEVFEAALPSLNKYNISVTQEILRAPSGRLVLITCLGHESGEYKESRLPLMEKENWQKTGAGITYARRYGFASLAGVVAANEDNDDQEDVPDEGEPARKPVIDSHADGFVEPTITFEQYQELGKMLADPKHKVHRDSILKKGGVRELKDMPKKHYDACMDYLRKVLQSSL